MPAAGALSIQTCDPFYASKDIDLSRPIVVSQNGYHQPDGTTVKEAEKVARELAKGVGIPHTVFVPHTTLTPSDRPVRAKRHKW
jgi:hypothetical protein